MSKFLKIGLIGLIGLSLSFFGCGKNEKHLLKIGKITEIKEGKTVENSDYGLSLHVENINDSRCPKKADCFWEGTASVTFQLITKKGEYKFTLDTHSPPNFINDTVIEGIKYQLKDVLPYPDSGRKQSKKTIKILADKN